MKIYKNQAGIAPLVIILSILVLGVVGFAAYRVGKSDNKSNNEAIATNTNSQPLASQQPEKTIPEGFVSYENKELGVKFAYPSEWGVVEVKKENLQGSSAGSGEDNSFRIFKREISRKNSIYFSLYKRFFCWPRVKCFRFRVC